MTEIDPNEDTTVRVRMQHVPLPFPLTLVSVAYRPAPWYLRALRAIRRFLGRWPS